MLSNLLFLLKFSVSVIQFIDPTDKRILINGKKEHVNSMQLLGGSEDNSCLFDPTRKLYCTSPISDIFSFEKLLIMNKLLFLSSYTAKNVIILQKNFFNSSNNISNNFYTSPVNFGIEWDSRPQIQAKPLPHPPPPRPLLCVCLFFGFFLDKIHLYCTASPIITIFLAQPLY